MKDGLLINEIRHVEIKQPPGSCTFSFSDEKKRSFRGMNQVLARTIRTDLKAGGRDGRLLCKYWAAGTKTHEKMDEIRVEEEDKEQEERKKRIEEIEIEWGMLGKKISLTISLVKNIWQPYFKLTHGQSDIWPFCCFFLSLAPSRWK